jgi:hypothetical protein
VPIGQAHLDVGRLMGDLEAEFARRAVRARLRRRTGAPSWCTSATSRRGRTPSRAAEESMRELRELARTAGTDVADVVVQMRERIDPKLVMGKGKLEEVVVRAMSSTRASWSSTASSPRRRRAHRQAHRPQGHRSNAAHPRHLRAARREPRRQAPGRARAAQVRDAAPRARRTTALAAHRRHRRARPGRDEARDRPPARRTASRTSSGSSRSSRKQREQRRRKRTRAACPRWPSSATRTPARARCSTRSRARRARGGQALRHARHAVAHAALRLGGLGRARGRHHRHRRLHSRAAQRTSSPPSARRSRRRPTPTSCLHVVDASDPAMDDHIARCSTSSRSSISELRQPSRERTQTRFS